MGLWLQAYGDLLKRYIAMFRLAWMHRAEMEFKDQLSYEVQFLPAAISLQETPVSPVPRVTMWMLIAFSGLVLLWSIVGRLDVVATAQGKIVPNDRTKIIQPFETATVKAIHVADGQTVKTGDLLIELDATSTEADKNRIFSDLTTAQLLVARGEAMLKFLKSGKAQKLQRAADMNALMFQEAERLLLAQYEEYLAKLNHVEAETVKREAEMRSTQELVHKLEQTSPIAEKRAQDFRNLVSRHLVSEHDYLEREQARIEQESDLASQRSRLNEIKASLREAKGQQQELIAETRRVSLDSINDGQHKVATLEQELLKADSRSKLMQLTSPVEGTVQQLAVYTVGGVVTPAQPLMVIVPGNNPLEIEAFIENKDIGFIKPNLDAEVKIETFQYTKDLVKNYFPEFELEISRKILDNNRTCQLQTENE